MSSPNEPELARYSQRGDAQQWFARVPCCATLSHNSSPIKHIIYIIKENRTYDQVFGDVERARQWSNVPTETASLAIFGAGKAATRPNGQRHSGCHSKPSRIGAAFWIVRPILRQLRSEPGWAQLVHRGVFFRITSDQGLPLGNTAVVGSGYDYEGFNRLPNYEPARNAPSLFGLIQLKAEDVAEFMRRFIPYLHGSRDVAGSPKQPLPVGCCCAQPVFPTATTVNL